MVKPRFGSWGNHVARCDTEGALRSHLEVIADYRWFRSCGAIVQTLIPPSGFDLRLVVARGRVVGAVTRVCADGEWRTNVALGARRVPTTPSAGAVRLALDAAATVNGSFVGVDLLPDGAGGWIVLEVNGAVELTDDYSFVGDVFTAAAEALADRLEGEPRLVRALA